MTICVGWTRGDCVYLVSDSAVTRSSPATTPRSLFGELHEDRPGLSVEESALKIFSWKNTAAAFAGDADTARSIFASYISLFRHFSPKDAFDKAWSSHTPFQSNKCSALFAYRFEKSPHLVLYSDDGPDQPREFAAIGAITNESKEHIWSALRGLPEKYTDPCDVVSGALAFFQSNSIYSNFMPEHIGGFYAGLFVAESGLRWAAPTIHLLFRSEDVAGRTRDVPNAVFVCPKEDMIFVCNDIEAGWTVFCNFSGANYGRDNREIISHARSIVSELDLEKIKIEHVSIYDISKRIITVLKVNGFQPAPGAHVRFENVHGKKKFVISCSEEVTNLLNRQVETGWIAFHDCTA